MVDQISSDRQRLWLAAAALLLSMVLIYSWRWYWQPVAKVNPTHWANKAISYSSTNHVQTLWLHRRHAARITLSQAYVLNADGNTIAVRLTAVSYPTLYPTAIRVDFELLNKADTAFILSQQNVLLQQRQ